MGRATKSTTTTSTYAVDRAVSLESTLNGLQRVSGRVEMSLRHFADRTLDRLATCSLQRRRQLRLGDRPVGGTTGRGRHQRQRPDAAARGRSASNSARFSRLLRPRLDGGVVARLTDAWA